MSVPRIQQSFCSTKISTIIKDTVQSLGYKEIRMDQFRNLLNTWCDHEIADSAQPRYRSIVTRPFSLLVRAGSGHETSYPRALKTAQNLHKSSPIVYTVTVGYQKCVHYSSQQQPATTTMVNSTA